MILKSVYKLPFISILCYYFSSFYTYGDDETFENVNMFNISLERLSSTKRRQAEYSYDWYLTLIQLGYHTLFGKIKMLLRQDVSCLAITTVATMRLSNASLALVVEAIISNVQEKTIKQHNTANSEIVLHSQLSIIGFLVPPHSIIQRT